MDKVFVPRYVLFSKGIAMDPSKIEAISLHGQRYEHFMRFEAFMASLLSTGD